MKNQPKQANAAASMCRDHKEKCVFVCLHKTCQHAFKIGCIRCRKDHAQHPNRLISLNQFHTMLAKPIRYLQTATAFKLMNLKKKMEYIRNFRTEILQKEMLLQASNGGIKTTIAAILEQHYHIRDAVSKLLPECLITNQEQYQASLQVCRDFMAYNPVKGELVFNNEVIKGSRVQLEKHLKTSHELIDNIREFLLKIIEVLLAHCAHGQQDDDIEFAEEGQNPTTFNIFIKNRTDASQTPNVKSHLEHQAFLEMFDEDREALNKQVDVLQHQIDVKSNLLTKIRNASEGRSFDGRDSLRTSLKDSKGEQLTATADSRYSRKAQQLREQYETILLNKDQYIQQLKEICRHLQEKLMQIPPMQAENFKSMQTELIKQQQANKVLTKSVEQLQTKVKQLSDLNSNLKLQQEKTGGKINQLMQELSKKTAEFEAEKSTLKSSAEESTKKLTQVASKFTRAVEELQRKDKEVTKQRKKYAELESMLEKIRENNSSSEKELLKWRDDYQSREKSLRSDLEKTQKQLQSLRYKNKNDEQRIRHLESRIKESNKEIEAKNDIIKERDRQLRDKDVQIKEKEQQWQSRASTTVSRVKQLENEIKSSRINDAALKNSEEQAKKYRQTREQLQMSIKKNQELKDKQHQLEMELQTLRMQLKQKKQDRSSYRSEAQTMNGNRTWRTNMQEPLRIQTVTSQEMIESPLKQRRVFVNKDERKQAYMEIKNIFKTVTEDMTVLQERLKQNTVIEKVYLKELERKRNQNKNLKKELESIKVYGGRPSEGRPTSQTPRGQNKESPPTPPANTKMDSQLYITKKYMKANAK